jgi:23S rRNA pseudouridine2605 synthase
VPVRLNRYLASTGVGSRRAADEVIRAGRVTVNGEAAQLGTLVSDDDDVRVDGRPVQVQATIVVLLHKPAGVVTTASDPQGRRTVVDLVQAPVRLFPVGRLDRDTTGLLLLTNDGALAARLMHPRHGVEKTYEVTVVGLVTAETAARLAAGVDLDGRRTAPARVRILRASARQSVIEIVLHEGRKRQVRRMCEAVGHHVLALHRSAYAGLRLGTLAPGASRVLQPAELELVRSAAGEG